MIHLVLLTPEIPQNTANIGRLCVCNDLCLHLIEPMGFRINAKEIKRAGLDYWQHLILIKHASFNDFITERKRKNEMDQLFFFSAKGTKNFWHQDYPSTPYLIFGNETQGFPKHIHREFSNQMLTIPMQGKQSRCLNLSSSAAIVTYEAMRQRSDIKNA